MRILVVEDEHKLANALKEGLQADQHSVELAHTGEEGFYLVETEPFDLVVLDVTLPGRSGIEILAAMRPEVLEKMIAPVPLKRLGKPEEIASAVRFVFENDFFTGRCLDIDGGLRL